MPLNASNPSWPLTSGKRPLHLTHAWWAATSDRLGAQSLIPLTFDSQFLGYAAVTDHDTYAPYDGLRVLRDLAGPEVAPHRWRSITVLTPGYNNLLGRQTNTDLVSSVLEDLNQEAVRHGAAAIAFLYLDEISTEWERAARNAGYHLIHLKPTWFIETTSADWGDFLNTLSFAHRKQLKQDDRLADRAALSLASPDPLEVAEVLIWGRYRLRKAYGVPAVLADIESEFWRLVESYRECLVAFTVSSPSSLLSSSLCIRSGRTLSILWSGRGTDSGRDGSYFWSTFRGPLSYAMSHNLTFYDLGPGSDFTKRSRGARSLPLKGLVKGLDDLSNATIRQVEEIQQ